jgi:hypothetical protein
MKTIAFIFLLPLAFLMVQPLSNTQQMSCKMQNCSKMMKCHNKKHPSTKGNKCENNGCNPFTACAYGNFYTVSKAVLSFTIIASKREKITPINDNRLASFSSDCWHPPERTLA